MKSIMSTLSVVAMPVGLLAAGLGILIWLAPVPSSELTAVQAHLIELADTVTKVAMGGIFAVVGFLLMRRG